MTKPINLIRLYTAIDADRRSLQLHVGEPEGLERDDLTLITAENFDRLKGVALGRVRIMIVETPEQAQSYAQSAQRQSTNEDPILAGAGILPSGEGATLTQSGGGGFFKGEIDILRSGVGSFSHLTDSEREQYIGSWALPAAMIEAYDPQDGRKVLVDRIAAEAARRLEACDPDLDLADFLKERIAEILEERQATITPDAGPRL
jgi:hypothetical protein